MRTAFGATTKVDGWLGTAQGDALPGQPVGVMTAPDTPSGQFTQAAVATTRSDGTWTATLPAGPSRRVQASYAGTATVEPSTSGAARVVVPASLTLAIHPRRTHWEGTILISGRLRGCCVPIAGRRTCGPARRLGRRHGRDRPCVRARRRPLSAPRTPSFVGAAPRPTGSGRPPRSRAGIRSPPAQAAESR